MSAEEYSPRISGWQLPAERSVLPEVFGAIHVPHDAGFLRRLLAFAGAGYLAAAGCMDPGKWSVEIGGGSAYAYRLLFVILLFNFMAIFLPVQSIRLGITSGRDVAQAGRNTHHRPVTILLWISAEIGIVVCDIAEVMGTAIIFALGAATFYSSCKNVGDIQLGEEMF